METTTTTTTALIKSSHDIRNEQRQARMEKYENRRNMLNNQSK